MNDFIIAISLLCILILVVLNWFAWMMIGFMFAFTRFYFMYELTPYIGLASSLALVLLGCRITTSNPVAFIKSKVGHLIGK